MRERYQFIVRMLNSGFEFRVDAYGEGISANDVGQRLLDRGLEPFQIEPVREWPYPDYANLTPHPPKPGVVHAPQVYYFTHRHVEARVPSRHDETDRHDANQEGGRDGAEQDSAAQGRGVDDTEPRGCDGQQGGVE